MSIRTERLLLRGWREPDREPWAALNADPAVREHFPSVLTRAESDAAFDRISSTLESRGWGLWAVDLDGRFLGFTGLSEATFEAPFTPAVEIGWRFARHAWGTGYATEAARAVLDHAFGELRLDEVVSFAATTNAPSMRVMERIGMTRDPTEDFDHPAVAPESPLRRHVLYRVHRH